MDKNYSHWIKMVHSMICVIGLLACTTLLFAGELVEVGRINIQGTATGLHYHVEGNYAYVVRRGYPSGPETFSVVNISNKSAPYIEGQIFNLPFHNAFDMWYGSGFAFTAHRFGGVNMIDVSNTASPLVISTARSTYTFAGIMSVGNYLYVADHSAGRSPGGMRIFDISGGYLNQIGALFGPPHGQGGGIDGRDLAISSDGLYAYQSSGKDDWGTARLYTYDISDKTNPSVLSAISNIFGAQLLISPDNKYLFISYMEPDDVTPPVKGTKIYDLSNRAQPVEVSTISLTNGGFLALDYARRILYINAYNDPNFPTDLGIHVFDISDPSQPTEVYLLSGNNFGNLFYYNNYLYAEEVVQSDRDLVIFTAYETVVEASIDFHPQTLNKKSKGKWITAYIELPDGYDVNDIDVCTVQLSKIDGHDLAAPISAEEHPTEVGDYDNDGIPDLMLKFDRTAVIATLGNKEGEVELTATGEVEGKQFEGSDVIRVINPGKGSKKGLSFSEEEKIATSCALLQNYPNPFNPETEIRFVLPEASHVVLRIFNTLGAEIRTLVNAEYEAGYHGIRWDGKDNFGNQVSSGLYFYMLMTEEFSDVRRVLLLR